MGGLVAADRDFGLGQMTSWQLGGQNSRILSKRYCLLSARRPGGGMIGGNWEGDGLQFIWPAAIRGIFFSSLSVLSLMIAVTGSASLKTRWWRDLMPWNAVRLKYGPKE